jgi:hypothetical protein
VVDEVGFLQVHTGSFRRPSPTIAEEVKLLSLLLWRRGTTKWWMRCGFSAPHRLVQETFADNC